MTDLTITMGTSNDDKAKKVVELMKKGLTKEQAMKKLATADMKAMLMDSVGAKSDEPVVNEEEAMPGEDESMSTDEETPMDAMDTDEGVEGEMPASEEEEDPTDPEAKKKKLIKEMVAMGLR